MNKILHIISSASGEYSTSTAIAQAGLAHTDVEIITLDLTQVHVPYVTGEVTMNLYGMLPDDQLSPTGQTIKQVRNDFIAQLKSVDTVIVSVPVWNFGVPAVLKAYIDLIGVIGQTWKIEDHQFIWLLTNVTNLIVVMSAGGMWYVDWAMAELNYTSPYLEKTLGWFLGMQNYKLFAVEGTNMDKDNAPARIEATKQELADYIANL
jgi:FMN-dependent NADH-azoreductase